MCDDTRQGELDVLNQPAEVETGASLKSLLSVSLLLLGFVGVENLGQQGDVRLALLLYESGLVQMFLGNRVFLLFPHLNLFLRLTLSEVPRPLLHLRLNRKHCSDCLRLRLHADSDSGSA